MAKKEYAVLFMNKDLPETILQHQYKEFVEHYTTGQALRDEIKYARLYSLKQLFTDEPERKGFYYCLSEDKNSRSCKIFTNIFYEDTKDMCEVFIPTLCTNLGKIL